MPSRQRAVSRYVDSQALVTIDLEVTRVAINRKNYKLGDRPSLSEREALGFGREEFPWINPFRPNCSGLVAVKSGEKRPPRRGEWYLSGAIPEAYKAPNDFRQSSHILTLVRVETRLVTTESERP